MSVFLNDELKNYTKLRKLAVNRGSEIDEVYRNINDMAMHLYQAQFLFTDEEKGLPV